SSRPPAIASPTSPSTRSGARACSPRRSRPPCWRGGPTSPCTRPRTCPPAARPAWSWPPCRCGATCATPWPVGRRAQLAWLRPDLSFTDLRGNIATRLSKLDRVDAVVVAYAALLRLDRAGDAAEVLGPDRLLPQVGQGALAVECREEDVETRRLLAGIEDAPSRTEVDAERAY